LAFGLIALLYLVTEELLVEAHEQPDSPLITAMSFVGLLALLMIEESLG
jgi:ZIP family zinc transporter